jgi:hypothetical protein
MTQTSALCRLPRPCDAFLLDGLIAPHAGGVDEGDREHRSVSRSRVVPATGVTIARLLPRRA